MNRLLSLTYYFIKWIKLLIRVLQGLSPKYLTFLYFLWVASFEIVPIWLNNMLILMFLLLKKLFKVSFGIAFSAFIALALTGSLSLNWYSLSDIFSCGNSQKSEGAIPGLYGGWESCVTLCFDQYYCTRFDACAGSLM